MHCRVLLWLLVGFVVSMASPAWAQKKKSGARPSYPPTMAKGRAETYKTVGDVELKAYIYAPADHQPEDSRPAIVLFFGGGWRKGSPAQFEHQCEYLAQRGIVAISADYRVADRHQVQAVECVRDAKSALRWVRKEAKRLGIDPNRIAAGGGSAGGHLAAAAGTLSKLDDPSEDLTISSRPNALVLFNPALVLAPVEGDSQPVRADLSERLGVEPSELSPLHHISPETPPTLILHGKDDSTVSFRSAELFSAAMEKAGVRCELIGYEGQEHGFFNYGRQNNEYYEKTLSEMDRFLVSLKYLEPAAP